MMPNCTNWNVWMEHGEVFEDCMAGLRKGCCCPKQCPKRHRATDWQVVDPSGTPLKDTLGNPLCFNTERQADTLAKLINQTGTAVYRSIPYIAGTDKKWE